MSEPKYLVAHADSAITDASWGELRPIMASHRIPPPQLEAIMRVIFLFLPQIVIQSSSVANNPILADMFQKYGTAFLSVLRKSTLIITDGNVNSFTDLAAELRERGAYGIPMKGPARVKHDRWISALDRNDVQASLYAVDLASSLKATQSEVFSGDRLQNIGLGRLAEKLSTLEREHGSLVGHSNRTWFFRLADQLPKSEWRLAEDLRWMSTGSLFLNIATVVEADLLLPNMKTKLLGLPDSVQPGARSRVGALFEDSPVVSSPWLDEGFHRISFDAIERLRTSPEFSQFSAALSGVAGSLSIEEGRARLQKSLSDYLSVVAYEIGKPRSGPKAVAREQHLTSWATVSRLSGYATAPAGGILGALTLISPSLVFDPLISVVLAGVAMIFTGKGLARRADAMHKEISEVGLQSGVLPPTGVSVADVVALL